MSNNKRFDLIKGVLNWVKYSCFVYTYFNLNYKRSDNYREFYMNRFMKVD